MYPVVAQVFANRIAGMGRERKVIFVPTSMAATSARRLFQTWDQLTRGDRQSVWTQGEYVERRQRKTLMKTAPGGAIRLLSAINGPGGVALICCFPRV